MRVRRWGFLALFLLLPEVLSGQSVTRGGPLLVRADSLRLAGETERARAVYEEVLRQQPENSRALFQLGRLLEGGSARAVSLLRAYTILEPQDAWGHWALGEALAAADSFGSAERALIEAQRIQPGERDFIFARARVMARAGRPGAAVEEYQRWLQIDPNDAEALREQAVQLRRAGQTGAEAAALRRLIRVGPDPAAERRLRAIRAERAPAVEPVLRVSSDSDGNAVTWAHLRVDAPIADEARFGFMGGHLRSQDDLEASAAWEGAAAFDWTPARGAKLSLQAGAAGITDGEASAEPEIIPLLRFRARWRPDRGPAADLRLQHEFVSATPLLLGTPVVLAEARGVADLPVLGPLYARGVARAGRLTTPLTTNERLGYGGGGVLRLGGATEIGALYQRTQYARDTEAGYFAPETIESAELGAYTEYYGLWPFVVALDAGVGVERIADWGVPRGDWERAFRVYSLLSWSLRPGRELRLEAEAYETRAGAAVAPTAEGWSWGSLALSVRAAVR